MLKTDYFINQVTCKYQFPGKIRGINSSMTTSEGHSLQCSTLQNPTFFPSGSREDTKFIITPLFSRKCRKLNIVKKNWYNINRLVVIKNQLPPPSHPCTSKSNPHYCLFSYFQKEITSTINTANLYIMIEKKSIQSFSAISSFTLLLQQQICQKNHVITPRHLSSFSRLRLFIICFLLPLIN